jgi:hypothetical protein
MQGKCEWARTKWEASKAYLKERKMQMEKRHEQAKALRAAGKTYKKIGEEMGVTRQRAMQLVKHVPGTYLHRQAMQEIPYKGLREWMLANGVSILELSRRCGCDVYRAIKGDGCQKYTVDAILRVTGLDYETCFAEGD